MVPTPIQPLDRYKAISAEMLDALRPAVVTAMRKYGITRGAAPGPSLVCNIIAACNPLTFDSDAEYWTKFTRGNAFASIGSLPGLALALFAAFGRYPQAT